MGAAGQAKAGGSGQGSCTQLAAAPESGNAGRRVKGVDWQVAPGIPGAVQDYLVFRRTIAEMLEAEYFKTDKRRIDLFVDDGTHFTNTRTFYLPYQTVVCNSLCGEAECRS